MAHEEVQVPGEIAWALTMLREGMDSVIVIGLRKDATTPDDVVMFCFGPPSVAEGLLCEGLQRIKGTTGTGAARALLSTLN